MQVAEIEATREQKMISTNMKEQVGDLHTLRNKRLSRNRRDFNLVYIAAFCLLVVLFTIARMSPRNWTARGGAGIPGSGVIDRARAEASIVASYSLLR